MDDSIRAEYQRRLAEGDREGALAYLRMLRTQADPSAREAFNQAIADIEGQSDAAAAASDRSYGGSVGPFGDQPDQWAAEHAPRGGGGAQAGVGSSTSGTEPAGTAATPSYGGSPGYPGTSAGVPSEPSYAGSPGYPGTSAGVPSEGGFAGGAGSAGVNAGQPAEGQHGGPGGILGTLAGGGLAGAIAGAGELIGIHPQNPFDHSKGGSHESSPSEAQNPLEAIGDRVHHAFDNVTGQGGTQHESAKHPPEEPPAGQGSSSV